jgi:hypothetical protein
MAVSLWLTVTLLSFQWKLCFPAPEALRYERLVLGEPEAHRYVRRQRREMNDQVPTRCAAEAGVFLLTDLAAAFI